MNAFELSKQAVIDGREARKKGEMPRLSEDEKKALLSRYHPDLKEEAYTTIRIGVNKGQKTVHEVVRLLEGESPLAENPPDLTPKHQVDVLVIGGGGAGASAALMAQSAGSKVLMSTKLRLGDSNTVMAEGGMQVAISPEDSPVRHFLDTLKGGQMANDRTLLKTLVSEGPANAKWLMDLGVMFDREEDGNLSIRSGGGSSLPRLLRCKDYTGLELMRVLKDAVLNEDIEILEFSPVIEFLTDGNGTCTGAVLKDLDTDKRIVVQAKTVILATGGIGRLHIQGFPTSNHYGATGDGLVLSYRAGAELKFQDTFQYHPTGSIFPEAMAGLLVTEAIRSVGAQLLNVKGERFVYELETRDAVASAVIRECEEGRGVETPAGRKGVWLDMPLVDVLHGEGTLADHFPNMLRQFSRYDIDITKAPVLIYPTLHYQNGGVKIDVEGESTLKNLFVAGEASGGIHGRNRLMGNSLLDIVVYGRRAGVAAAKRASALGFCPLTLKHLEDFKTQKKAAGVVSETVSPILFPDYVNKG
ncbi:MAG: FAD-binding protein [Nitrospirae bacterium]|nr:FAD-binding protein [Candidatus Manganitrophaceae bacterium]